QRRLLHLDRRQRDAQRKGGHSEHGPHEEVTHAHPFGTPGCAFRAAFLPGVKQAGRARFPNRKPLIGSKTCGMPPQPTYLTFINCLRSVDSSSSVFSSAASNIS